MVVKIYENTPVVVHSHQWSFRWGRRGRRFGRPFLLFGRGRGGDSLGRSTILALLVFGWDLRLELWDRRVVPFFALLNLFVGPGLVDENELPRQLLVFGTASNPIGDHHRAGMCTSCRDGNDRPGRVLASIANVVIGHTVVVGKAARKL